MKRSDGSYFFGLPTKFGADPKTGGKIQYPVIAFDIKERHKALMEAIREQGPAFIEKRLANKDNPITSPKTKLNEPEQDRQPKPLESSIDAKQKIDNSKPKSAAPKVWWDPPKKKSVSQKPFSNR